MITEKYRPKTEGELVGNRDAIAKLKEAIEKKEACLVFGPPGVGKTTSVYVISRMFGYSVLEVNASDKRKKDELSKLLSLSKMRTFVPVLFLLDEVDGIGNWKVVKQIIKESDHPVVLVANDEYKIPKGVRELCKRIRFYNPNLADVVKRIREVSVEEGKKPDFSKISEDVRASLIACFFKGDKYVSESDFDIVEDAIVRKKFDGFKDYHMVWILDNLESFFYGKDLYDAVQILALADRVGRVEVLKELPSGKGKVKYPHYLRRIKISRGNKKNG